MSRKNSVFLWLLPLLALGCGGTLQVGAYKSGQVVEAEGSDLKEAERKAVSSLFILYLSSAAQVSSVGSLERDILAHAAGYIEKQEVLESSHGRVRLLALVLYSKLGRALETMGIVRPQGVKARPRVAISIEEKDAQASHPGKAAQALGRVLSETGYSVNYVENGSAAEIFVSGQARALRVQDQRLEDMHVFKARLEIEATGMSRLVQEASAVDSQADTAVDKAEASCKIGRA